VPVRLTAAFSIAKVEVKNLEWSNMLTGSAYQWRIPHPENISSNKECNLFPCLLFGERIFIQIKKEGRVIKPKYVMQCRNSWTFMERWTFDILLYISFIVINTCSHVTNLPNCAMSFQGNKATLCILHGVLPPCSHPQFAQFGRYLLTALTINS
jgi:hypothetical protein